MSKLRLAPLDPAHPENRGVLAYLARGSAAKPSARPSEHPDPYTGAGSHPDVVARVWDDLGRGLARAERALVFGHPALVHAHAGIVLAVALGTQYALRVPSAVRDAARAAGLVTRHVYRTDGTVLELATFGAAWHFGAWAPGEPAWVLAEHARLAALERRV